MATRVHATVLQLINSGLVVLSFPTTCDGCGTLVRFVGEHKPMGNWYCPVCATWLHYGTPEGAAIETWKRAQRVQNTSVLFPLDGDFE